MISLTKTADLIKKNLWLFIAMILVIAIIILIIFRYYFSQKAKTPPIEPPAFEEKIITTSNFNTDKLAIPEESPDELPLYLTTKENLLNSSTTIAQKLGFSEAATPLQDINLGQGVTYSNPTGALLIYKDSLNYIRYVSKEVSGNFKNQGELKKTAVDFISSLNQAIPDFQIRNISYYKISDEFLTKTESEQDAAIVSITLRPTLNVYEFISAGSETTAFFNRQNELFNLIYEPTKLEQSTENYPIIDAKKAKEALLINKGSLIRIGTVNDYTPPPTNLDTVNLEKMYLAYYLPLHTTLAQPVWIFQGKANSPQGTIEVSYAVPAIEKTYLLTPSPKP